MSPQAQRRRKISRRAVLAVAYNLVVLALLVAGIEALARWKGYRPWNPTLRPIDVTPGGRFFAAHPTLGYSHLPGAFQVTLFKRYTFQVTHGEDTLRITEPRTTEPWITEPRSVEAQAARPQIWIFGGSFTHGWSLDDAATYPWLVQEHLPRWKVVNFGVSGYGTLHGLIQFREALATRPAPAMAVVAYAPFHDARNTFVRSRRKHVARWNRLGPLSQPAARLDADGTLRITMAEVAYREVPLMRVSAAAHWLETRWNQAEERRVDSRAVTFGILDTWAEEARRAGVELVIAAIDGGAEEVLAHAAERGLPTVDISVPLDAAPGFRNLPWDPHPNARAHREYAGQLMRFLNTQLRE